MAHEGNGRQSVGQSFQCDGPTGYASVSCAAPNTVHESGFVWRIAPKEPNPFTPEEPFAGHPECLAAKPAPVVSASDEPQWPELADRLLWPVAEVQYAFPGRLA